MRRSSQWLAEHEAKQRGKFAPTLRREVDLHNEISEYCRAKGWLYWKSRTDKRTGRPGGEPDFIILGQCSGKMFEVDSNFAVVFLVECKKPKGKLSETQLATIAHAEKLGHEIHVVHTMEEFLKVVE